MNLKKEKAHFLVVECFCLSSAYPGHSKTNSESEKKNSLFVVECCFWNMVSEAWLLITFVVSFLVCLRSCLEIVWKQFENFVGSVLACVYKWSKTCWKYFEKYSEMFWRKRFENLFWKLRSPGKSRIPNTAATPLHEKELIYKLIWEQQMWQLMKIFTDVRRQRESLSVY